MHDDADAYVAFQEGSRLLADGNAHAAVVALERARRLEPEKGSVREALARAYYTSGRFGNAEREFRAALDLEPLLHPHQLFLSGGGLTHTSLDATVVLCT